MKKNLLLLLTLLLWAGASYAQTKVTGKVTSAEDGTPVIVSVAVKGTTVGVYTDLDGKYSINLPKDKNILVFSSIGYTTVEVPVNGRAVVDVQIKTDALNLEEVVVVGYGSAKKPGTVIGSIQQVSSKKIQEKPVANVMDALQGQVAGLQVFTSSGEPSATSSVRLRGVGSLTAGNTPLYVMDGIPIDAGTVLSLNQNDFESISVLKDASATSIYGARASNGVIFITTKRGSNSGDAKITVNASYGVSSLANKKFLSPMNSEQLLAHQLEYGIITQTQFNTYKTAGVDTKWVDYFFTDNAPTYAADLAVQGGSEKTTYYLSGAYFNQDGVVPRSKYEKYTFRSNIDSKLRKWLKVGVNLSGGYDERQNNGYTFQTSNSTSGGIFGTILNQPYHNPYGPNGEKLYKIPGLNRYSPDYLLEKQPSKSNNVQFNGSGYILLTPIAGLSIKSQAGIDAYDYRTSSKRLPSYEGSLNNGRTAESFSRGITRTITNTIEYKFDLYEDHSITVLGGQEGIGFIYDAFGASTTGQTDDRQTLLTNGPTNENPTNSKYEYLYLSYFGRVDYSYQNKYFFDFSLRNDNSSRFGKEKQSAVHYAFGAMWNIKKENFMSNIKEITKLTLKGSIGTTGNSSIGNYDHLALIGSNQYNGQPGRGLSSAGNPELSWETQILSNIGVSAEFFDRYRLDIEYYHRKTDNMLMNVPYPYTSGFSQVLANVGSMSNAGIDLTVGADIIKTKNSLLTFSATFNYNKNKITNLFYGLNEWVVPNTGVSYVVGKAVEFYYPVYAGVNPANGKQLWQIPGTDQTTEVYNEAALKQTTGKPRYAPIAGGFSINFNYKNFAISTDFSYVLGKYLINNDRYFSENPYNFRGYNQSERVLALWKNVGDITDVPKYGEVRQFDTHLLENASFLRCKNLNVSYTLPKNWIKKTQLINSVKFYGTARNLFTVTKYLGADPEIDSNLTYGAYPNTRQYSIGVQIIF